MHLFSGFPTSGHTKGFTINASQSPTQTHHSHTTGGVSTTRGNRQPVWSSHGHIDTGWRSNQRPSGCQWLYLLWRPSVPVYIHLNRVHSPAFPTSFFNNTLDWPIHIRGCVSINVRYFPYRINVRLTHVWTPVKTHSLGPLTRISRPRPSDIHNNCLSLSLMRLSSLPCTFANLSGSFLSFCLLFAVGAVDNDGKLKTSCSNSGIVFLSQWTYGKMEIQPS